MGIEATDAPTGIVFIGAKKLWNGNVLYQFNTRDAAIWFNQPGVQQAFLTKYGAMSNIKNKLFYIIAEFVPTMFNAGTKSAHAHIEEDSSMGTSVAMAWLATSRLAKMVVFAGAGLWWLESWSNPALLSLADCFFFSWLFWTGYSWQMLANW